MQVVDTNFILRYLMELLDVERFISLIQKDQFNYTKWRESLHQELEHLSLEEISITASKTHRKQ